MVMCSRISSEMSVSQKRKVGFSGIFELRELCAYLELDNVLGHYEIVLLEIC